LAAQFLEAISVVVVVGGLSYVFFKVLNALKLLRSDPAHEVHGLDVPEMGVPGYTNVDVVMPGGNFRTPRPAIRPGAAAAK
jgi:Amt family ammonium transporter